MSTSQWVIFLKKKNVNGESKWFEDGDEENDGKYVGKIENGKPNGSRNLQLVLWEKVCRGMEERERMELNKLRQIR